MIIPPAHLVWIVLVLCGTILVFVAEDFPEDQLMLAIASALFLATLVAFLRAVFWRGATS